ncbi:MAG: hypothetical protein R3D59_11190 [Paracoccaceae bacterium]
MPRLASPPSGWHLVGPSSGPPCAPSATPRWRRRWRRPKRWSRRWRRPRAWWPRSALRTTCFATGKRPRSGLVLAEALAAEGIRTTAGDLPMRASEDFGRFGDRAEAAMFLLGAGEGEPGASQPRLRFPDALIEPGADLHPGVARLLYER